VRLEGGGGNIQAVKEEGVGAGAGRKGGHGSGGARLRWQRWFGWRRKKVRVGHMGQRGQTGRLAGWAKTEENLFFE
jgi:hypothetical protein